MLHYRHTTRLIKHDYSFGTYFITIGTHKHGRIFGEIKNTTFIPNILGQIVIRYEQNISSRFPNTKIITSQLMPNHLHFILNIKNTVGARFPRPIQSAGRAPTLGNIIAWFKYNSTRDINKLKMLDTFKIFQRNYYEHIIRDKQDLFQKIQYIKNNPSAWPHDPENKHPPSP